MKRTGERLAALLLVCLALGQGREESDFLQRPAGRPANDDIAQAEWVQSLLQFRSNSSFAVAYDSYPGGNVALYILRYRLYTLPSTMYCFVYLSSYAMPQVI